MVVNFVAGYVGRAIFAIENFVGVGNALIERRSQGNQFKSRARLVQCADRAIHAEFSRRSGGRRVGIKSRPVGHRQQFPVVGIHHHHGAGQRVSLVYRRG